MTQVKKILFDLGRVIIDLNWNKSLQEMNLSENTISIISDWNTFHLFEEGQISANHFYQEFIEYFKIKLSYQSFEKSWNACLLGPFPGISNLLDQINVPIFALSNTNEIHYQYFLRWPLPQFQKVYASHLLKARKPNFQIYDMALKDMDEQPQNILFIDDIDQNLEAAKKIGFQVRKSVSSISTLKSILTEFNLI